MVNQKRSIKQSGARILGSGLICALGTNKQACFESLKAGRSGVSACTLLQTIHRNNFPMGEIKWTNGELLAVLNIPKSQATNYTRTTLLSIIAVREALTEANLIDKEGRFSPSGKRIGLVVGTSVGGMTETELKFGQRSDLHYLATHPCGDVAEKTASYFGSFDYYTSINTACSSAANAILHGLKLLKSGMLDQVIVGGADALSVYTVNGFNSLMILSDEACKPFDEERKGLNLGEGAAYLVLDKEDPLDQVSFRVLGAANSNDAYHQTASSPEGNGAYASMKKALQKSGLFPKEVDYINAHGTGTPNNDLTEGVAIQRLFGDDIPLFSSTKEYTGHTLGASAAIEAVISLLSLENNMIFPNHSFKHKMNELSIAPVTTLLTKDIHVVLSNSFGFAGNDSSVVFAKLEAQ